MGAEALRAGNAVESASDRGPAAGAEIGATRIGPGTAGPTCTRDGEWVRARLTGSSAATAADPDLEELFDWIRLVAERRARNVSSHERNDVVQDALAQVWQMMRESSAQLAAADNPAALLERVVARAVGQARHRASMAGLGGVPPNGRNWRARYPQVLGGEVGLRVLSQLPASTAAPATEVEKTASRVAEFVYEQIGVELSDDAIDAIDYVLDRLVAGVRRTTLVRGGHSGLRTDPAMRHLGFSEASAGAFACWLLGREDAQRHVPSVLNAFLDRELLTPAVAARWHRQAIAFGFVVERDESIADGPCVKRRSA